MKREIEMILLVLDTGYDDDDYYYYDHDVMMMMEWEEEELQRNAMQGLSIIIPSTQKNNHQLIIN